MNNNHKCEISHDFLHIEVTDLLNIRYNAYSGDSSFEEEIRINYCPKCGKKLQANKKR